MFISHDISSVGLLILFWACLFQILFFKIQSQCNHAILSHFSSRKLFIKDNHAKVCMCTNKPRQKGRLRLNNYCTVFPFSRQLFFCNIAQKPDRKNGQIHWTISYVQTCLLGTYCNKAVLLVFLSIETLVSYAMAGFIYRTFMGNVNINFDWFIKTGRKSRQHDLNPRSNFFANKSSKTMYSLHGLGELVSIMCFLLINACQQFSFKLFVCLSVWYAHDEWWTYSFAQRT